MKCSKLPVRLTTRLAATYKNMTRLLFITLLAFSTTLSLESRAFCLGDGDASIIDQGIFIANAITSTSDSIPVMGDIFTLNIKSELSQMVIIQVYAYHKPLPNGDANPDAKKIDWSEYQPVKPSEAKYRSRSTNGATVYHQFRLDRASVKTVALSFPYKALKLNQGKHLLAYRIRLWKVENGKHILLQDEPTNINRIANVVSDTEDERLDISWKFGIAVTERPYPFEFTIGNNSDEETSP